MDRRFLGILAAVVIVLIGVFAITQHSSNNSNSGGGSAGQPTNHVEGQGTTGVKLVEYGDYECPICGEYWQSMQDVYNEYSTQIYFQFRNLPLTQIHPNAFAAARAAEAASQQGKFWQMHDQLYQNQDPNGVSGWVADHADVLNNYFVKFAQNIGLNINQFKNDYASAKVNDSINADLAAFNQTNQPEATPTFFLDGKVLDNANLGVPGTNGLDHPATLKNFEKVINAEIAKKQKQ